MPDTVAQVATDAIDTLADLIDDVADELRDLVSEYESDLTQGETAAAEFTQHYREEVAILRQRLKEATGGDS